MTFAPKDMNPVDFDVKDDLHGIGYAPLSINKSKSSKVEEERLTFGGHSKGSSGKVRVSVIIDLCSPHHITDIHVHVTRTSTCIFIFNTDVYASFVILVDDGV